MEFTLIFPCVFFAFILLVILFKRGFDASAYVTLLYLIVGVCNVIAYETLPSNYGGSYYLHDKVSISAMLVYCSLIGICIFPIYKLNPRNIDFKRFRAEKITRFLTYACLIALVFNLIFNWKQLVFILSYGDMGKLRDQVYDGVKFYSEGGSTVLRLLAKPFNIIASCSFVLFPLFFISLLTTKTKFRFKLAMLLGTTNGIVDGILSLDRSSFVTWLLYLGLNLVIFWPQLGKKLRKQLYPIFGCFVGLGLLYLVLMTVSRFERTDHGAEGGVLAYAGQSYTNFCFLFDHYDNKTGFNGVYLFPAVHEFVTKDYEGSLDYQRQQSFKSGYKVTIFYTFLGSFLIDNNQSGPFVIVALYLFLFYKALIKKRGGRISLKNFIFCYVLICIPTFGIFGYPFTRGIVQLGMIFLIIIFNLKSFNPELFDAKPWKLPKWKNSGGPTENGFNFDKNKK